MIYQPELIMQNQEFLIQTLNLNAKHILSPPSPKIF